MTDKLQIDLVGADALLGPLTRALAVLDHPRDMLEAIGAELEANINLRFETKTDAAGHAWAPILPITAQIWESMHGGNALPGSLLERTRNMRNSLTHNATDNAVEVGFSADYAGYHITGTKKMVRRDPLFGTVNAEASQGTMGAQDEADVVAVIESFLGDALG